MDRKQRGAARAKESYYKKKEEAAKAKALNKFLQRKAPQLLLKFEEEYREGREESVTGTKTSAIPDKNGAGIDFMEDDTQWMDDLPDLGPSLPELDPFRLNTLMEDDLPELDSSLP
jgi:hypothetical protein